MIQKPLLVVIVGPTAVGKTAVSIDLAKQFGSEIVSADSRQFFKETNIGTAKPTKEEQTEVKHHFVDSLSIHEAYDAGQFALDAEKLLHELFDGHQVVFMVGGSGLYVKAVCEGLDDMPEVPQKIRERLKAEFEELGLKPLIEELKERDPAHFEIVDRQNPQRVIRALEIIRATGKTYTAYRQRADNSQEDRAFRVLKIGLNMDREELYNRIDKRMDGMIESGLFEEAKSLHQYKELNALQTVGYREIFGYLDGEYDKKEAIRLLKRNSRRYAKRQLTWFTRDEEVRWFAPDQFEEIKALIEEQL